MRKYNHFGNEIDLAVLAGIYHWYIAYDNLEKARCEYRVVEEGVKIE